MPAIDIKPPVSVAATIQNGQSLSAAVTIPDGRTVTAIIPKTGLAGDAIEFEASADRVDFYPLRDNANALVSIDITAGAATFIDQTVLMWARALKVRTTASGSAQTQTGDQSVEIVFG